MDDFEQALMSGLKRAGCDPSRPLLVAVSGGPDSMALLAGLMRLSDVANVAVPRLIATHFNHRLRGPESEGDARYVVDFCAQHGVESLIGTGDVMAFRKSEGLSVELASRQMRYSFFADTVQRLGAQAIATAHTVDDQAETVLMHAARGSGINGLAAMRLRTSLSFQPGQPAIEVIRPLLQVSRESTVAYCARMDIRPRHDSSNDDLAIPRNLLRHEVVPSLRKINPALSEALARLADLADRDAGYMADQSDRAWIGLARVSADSVSFPRAALTKEHPAISARLFGNAFQTIAGSLENLSMAHHDAIEDLLESPTASSLDLPRGVSVVLTYDDLVFTRDPVGSGPPCPFPVEIVASDLPTPGSVSLGPDHVVSATFQPVPSDPASEAPSVAYLDAKAVGGKLTVRSRRNGDRFQPLGVATSDHDGEPREISRKLQDFMVDQRVPRAWRDRVPIIDTPRGVAWVAGYRPAEWAKITDATVSAIRLELKNTASVTPEDSH
jgi:tRNA(Ile)-lysidine synthase